MAHTRVPAESASAVAPHATAAHSAVAAPASARRAAPSASASAPAAASAAPRTAKKTPTSLADFLPKSLGGTPLDRHMGNALMGALPGGAAIGSYLDMKHHKAININLMPVQDLPTARAALHGLEPGQTKKAPAAGVVFKAFDVEGFTVVLTRYLHAKKSEAEAVIADKVDVRLSVQPTSDPDEAVKLFRQLDLAGIAKFARKTM